MRQIRAMADDHVAGRANYLDELDAIASLAVAERVLFTAPKVERTNGVAASADASVEAWR